MDASRWIRVGGVDGTVREDGSETTGSAPCPGGVPTALAVSEPRAALALAQAQPGYEALLTTADGQTLATRGWKLLEAPATPCAAPLP